MTDTFTVRATALALSALAALAIVAGADAMARQQYVAADAVVAAQAASQPVALQNVVIVGHRRAKV